MRAPRHGGLIVLVAAGAASAVSPPSPADIPQVRSASFDIEYRVSAEAGPLGSVTLWVTTDEGESWQVYGDDPDGQSPFPFEAAVEGLHGFYLVAANESGPSSEAPDETTEPHQWAFVDFTAPAVQVHALVVAASTGGGRRLQIHWTALDDHLGPRPISLDYRVADDERWRGVASGVSNTGRYDWAAPDSVAGVLRVRVTVTDRGGNVVAAESPPLDVAAWSASSAPRNAAKSTDKTDVEPSEKARARAAALYQQGAWHQLRGETRLAIARFRDALRLNPDLTVALEDMGRALYAENRTVEAAEVFQLALNQNANSRAALEGLARAYIVDRRFADAGEQLRRIVRNNPRDAAAWLHLGDVAVYQGDEILAREHYGKATRVDASAAEVIAKARLRLADLSNLRAMYGPGPDSQ